MGDSQRPQPVPACHRECILSARNGEPSCSRRSQQEGSVPASATASRRPGIVPAACSSAAMPGAMPGLPAVCGSPRPHILGVLPLVAGGIAEPGLQIARPPTIITGSLAVLSALLGIHRRFPTRGRPHVCAVHAHLYPVHDQPHLIGRREAQMFINWPPSVSRV